MFGGYQTPLRYKALKEIRDVSLYKIGDKQVSLHECALLGQYENLQAILTNQSCALDQRDHRGINALHYSARGGHMNCFKLLLQQSNQDMLLSETRRSYCNILHSAALGGNAQLVKYIMETFQQAYSSEMLERFVTMENIYGKLPAHCAAQSGDIPTFRLLTEGFNINIQAVAKDGRMFHHLAAERGFLQMVEYLYAMLSTADFRTVTKEGHDILYFSARSGNLKLVEFTVNKLITEKDKTLCNENILKWTPLFAASLSFHPEVVEYLLKIDNTLSVNSVSAANLQSPLSCAAGSGCLEMVKTLIKHGANPRISCTKPILHFAAEGGNIELMDYLMNECGLTDQLFEEPKILGSCPQNIFHHAVASGDDQMVRFLLQKKQIYPQLEGLLYCTGVTPFTLACILGNLKAVKYFISENVYPKNAVTCILDTAKAKNRKYLDVVKYLLDTLCPKESPQAEEIKITSLLHILAQWCEDVQFIKSELIEARGFHPNALCDIGSSTYVSPLFSALRAPNIPVAKMLIRDYTPTSTKDIENLFHGACLGGSLKLTKLLIEKVPAVLHNKTSRFHVPLFGYLYPIHLAVLSQSLELVKYLVDELDIAANAKNQSHLTPLHLAACKQSRFSRCQADIITYLIFSSGYLSLAAKVSNFYNMEEPNLMPIDIAANKEIRSLLEKYSPNLVAERLLTTYDSITIDWKSPLGNGKFGSVFRGTYRYTPVAVKVITPTPKVPFKSVYLSFMREVGVMGSLRHQNLCLIEAAAIGDGKFILVMELMESSLLKYINDNNVPLPNNQIKKFAIDICRGMLALHTNDPVILHRDLKLANILLNSEGRAKISDFGISRYSFVKGEAEVYKNILPESFDPNKDQFTEQEDIYAFGICLLGMVLSPNNLRETNQRQFYIKSFSNNYCANKNLVDIIKKCTEEYRNERYKTFEDVLRDVEQIPTEIPTASEVCGSSISISPPGDDGYVSVEDETLWDIRHGDGDGDEDGDEDEDGDGDGDGGGDENPPSGVYITIGNMCE